MSRFFSLSRLHAILAKEFIQMRRDRVTFAMMLGVPLMLLILFGYAINNDPKRLPAALLALGNDPYSRAMVTALENSNYYRFDRRIASAAEGAELLQTGTVAFVVTIPADFGRRVARADHPQILVEADASDPSAASGAIASVNQIAAQALQHVQNDQGQAAAREAGQVNVIVHRLYNPEAVSQFNIVPGLLGVILQMTMVMMTAMALTRETERGTMENLLAMPGTPTEIMLGKVLPYAAVGAVQVVVVLLAAKLLFTVPFVGSLLLLLSTIFLFVLGLVLLGYCMSTVSRTQMQAMQLTFFFFLPSILLSGFMFPFRGMPDWAQLLGEVFPLTHFLRIVRAVMLKGAEFPAIASEVAWLLGFVTLFAALALLRFRRTLD